MIINKILLILICCVSFIKSNAQFVSEQKMLNSFSLTDAVIYFDLNDDALVQKYAQLLQQDIEMVTGRKLFILHNVAALQKTTIIIGPAGKSSLIKQLVQQNKINTGSIKNKWEA